MMHQRYVPEPDCNATLEVLTENGSYQIKGLTPERWCAIMREAA